MRAELISVEAVRFGDFELDLGRRELRKRGLRLNLETKQFQILELLVENSSSPGNAKRTTREALARHLRAV